ncbi:MAG: Ig-like domain-containing protein, partial [Mariprofundaceae bacterium]|nr:Ig-like domain-containing protein [Mariprofundaceae bacterium]
SANGGFISVSPAQATSDPVTGILTVAVTDIYSVNDTVTVWASVGATSSPYSNIQLSFVGNAPTQPTTIGIRSDKASVLTDGVDVATLTVTVQDANGAAVSNALVDIATTGGLLSKSQVQTGALGTATVTLGAGSNRSNVTATVTATVVGVAPAVTTQMPIQITGTTLTIAGLTSNLDTLGAISDTLTFTLKDGGNQPIFGKTLSVSSNGGGLRFNATNTDPYSLTTDVTGAASLTVDAYGALAGTKTLTVSLDANTKATQAYNVSGAAFGITAPATDPYAMSTADTYTITVSNVLPATAAVTFSTTLGLLDAAATTVTKNAVAGVASATINSTVAGIANVQVSVAGTTTQSTSTRFAISLPASAASQIALQAGANVVAISSGSVSNSVQLTATVRDVYGQPVGQSPVIFTIKNPTGGGETISPVLVQTDVSGVALATFTSGSLSSGAQGVDIYATIVKTTGLPAADPHAITNMVIGGTAGSVVIGRGTKVAVLDSATYQLPMSVVVADSNGNAVSGAQVTLNAWPSHYRFGYWGGTANCQAVVIPTTIGSSIVNEDINKNLILDTGEDKTHTMASYFISSKTGYPVVSTDPYANTIPGPTPAANDGVLTPGNSVAGTLPTSVITDVNGVATFNLTYLKADAAWVTTAITASTQVLGSESTGVIEFALPALIADTRACTLPSSPFNNPLWGL